MTVGINLPKDKHLIVDGDILLYRCGFAAERQKYLVQKGDEHVELDSAKEAKSEVERSGKGIIWTRREVEPLENAVANINRAIDTMLEELWTKNTGKLDIYLTGKGNFRESLAVTKTYKDNRDPTHRPKHYRALKEHLIKRWNGRVINGQEADDAVGIHAYSLYTDDYIVVSNDKDLDQISGFHYDWTTKRSWYITEEQALKTFYIQLLAGDTADNIPGVVSVAKATEAIEECADPHECSLKVKELYEKAYPDYWADRVEEISELVWIRRKDPPSHGCKPPFWDNLHKDG